MPTATRSAKRASRPFVEPLTPDPTRAKLLAAATAVFAERGFHAATVREISLRAGANVAAVNYHFRDKLGLYTEVLRAVVTSVGQDIKRTAFERDLPAEERLRMAVKVWISRLYGTDRPSLPFRLMRHELLRPTPALTKVVDEVIRPNYDRLRSTVAELLGLPADHETTRLCVHSVMGQALLYPVAAPVLARLWPQFTMTPAELERIADHVANFSLAALRNFKAKARHDKLA